MNNAKQGVGEPYLPPRLRMLGSVHVLTQTLPLKELGSSDGLLFAPHHVGNTS
jgi:hypothetical protein